MTPRGYYDPPDEDGWDEYLHGPRATWLARKLRDLDDEPDDTDPIVDDDERQQIAHAIAWERED